MVYVIKLTGLVDYDTVTKVVEIHLQEDKGWSAFNHLKQTLMDLPTGDSYYMGFGQVYQVDLWVWDTSTQASVKPLAKHAF